MDIFASILAPWIGEGFAVQLFWGLGFMGLFFVVVLGLLTLIFGHHGDSGGDGHGFGWNNLLSLKSIAALLLGLGFGGAALSENGFPIIVAIGGGIGIGLLLAVFFAFMMGGLYRLRSDGTVRLWEAIGRRAKVYIRIPGEETAPGEIQVAFAGRMINIPAFTRGPELPTGTEVLVTSVHGQNALDVQKATDDPLQLN